MNITPLNRLNKTMLCMAICLVPLTHGSVCASQAGDGPPKSPAKEKVMEEKAKRRVPQVAPVVAHGIRYEVLRGARSRGFAQNGGVLAAIDLASGKERWTLQVYTAHHDEKEETDVQEVFITEIKLSADRQFLHVATETQKRFTVKLADRSVVEDK